jgi:hypothetical protein
MSSKVRNYCNCLCRAAPLTPTLVHSRLFRLSDRRAAAEREVMLALLAVFTARTGRLLLALRLPVGQALAGEPRWLPGWLRAPAGQAAGYCRCRRERAGAARQRSSLAVGVGDRGRAGSEAASVQCTVWRSASVRCQAAPPSRRSGVRSQWRGTRRALRLRALPARPAGRGVPCARARPLRAPRAAPDASATLVPRRVAR